MTDETTQHVEALLFSRGGPITKKELGRLLHKNDEEIEAVIHSYANMLNDRGVRIVETDTEVELRAAPEAAALLEALQEEELSKSLGPAAQETLAIILYRGPMSRSRIEYIRGVSCQAILRSLLIRGLIERREHGPHRSEYAATTDLLAFLGIPNCEALPEYAHMREELLSFEQGVKRENDENPLFTKTVSDQTNQPT